MPSAYRVAAPSIRIVPWAALASCWPLPQQLLPVSATGGGRRRCALGIFSGKIILISRLSRPAGRSKRIFTGGVVKADGIFVLFPALSSVKARFRNAHRRFFTKTKIGACRWSSCTSRFCFLCVGCGTKHSRCRAGSCRANRAAASRRKEKGMEEWSGALADAPFFWCNVVRIS